MVDSSGLKIPYEDLQKYFKINELCISALAEEEKTGQLSRAQLEEKLPHAFLEVQECLAKILKDNKITDHQQYAEHNRKVLSVLSDSILKIQQKCASIKVETIQTPLLLSELRTSLEQSLGTHSKNEIDQLIGNFDGMISSFESHFTELNDKFQTLQDTIDTNQKYIQTLNSQVQEKEKIIEAYKGQVEVLHSELQDQKSRDIKNSGSSHPPKELSSSLPIEKNEEEKKPEEVDKPSFPHLPCYDVPDFSQIWFDGKFQFKKDLYIDESGGKQTVEGEWLNGVPHGICIMEDKQTRGVMIFTNGKVDGAPSWIENKRNGQRMSFQRTSEMNPKGLIRMYNSDKEEDAYKVASTTNQQQLTPGWLNQIINIKERQEGTHLKQFFADGDVQELETDENNNPIKRLEWRLKEDGTHDKYKLEKVVRNVDGTEEETFEEDIETFICNEKVC